MPTTSYDKSQANACTAICILPGVFMRWISYFARAISFIERGGDIIPFHSLPGGFYIIPVSLFYIISVSLFYIISVSLFLFHYLYHSDIIKSISFLYHYSCIIPISLFYIIPVSLILYHCDIINSVSLILYHCDIIILYHSCIIILYHSCIINSISLILYHSCIIILYHSCIINSISLRYH